MKKLVFTMAALTAFAVSNAQTTTEMQPNQTPTKKSTTADGKGTVKKGPVTNETATPAGGTVTTTGGTTGTETKKSGTRMAINEKGLPGEKKPATETKAATNSNPK
jgi:hypothetical protein